MLWVHCNNKVKRITMINEKETIMLKFICYPKCTTCQKAKKWLDDNKIEYKLHDIQREQSNI